MKTKIVGILVCTLLIATAVLPIVMSTNIGKITIVKNSELEENKLVQDGMLEETVVSAAYDLEVFVDPSNPSEISLTNDVYEIYEGQTLIINITVYWDPPHPEKIICLWVDYSTMPQGATFPECVCDYGEVTGQLIWTPEVGQAGEYEIVFYAGEDCEVPIGSFSITVIVYPAEQAEVFIVTPSDGDMVYGDVFLQAYVEDTDTNIMMTNFYYSLNQQSWHLIASDFDGTDTPASGEILPGTTYGDGWSCHWDVSEFDEGWYYVSAEMWDIYEQMIGEDIIRLYLEPTPPIPSFSSINDGDIISGDILLSITVPDENIDYVLYEWDASKTNWSRTITVKIQDNFCNNLDGKDLSDSACGPTAAAACLDYWNDTGKFPDLMKNGTTKYINQSELVDTIARLMGLTAAGTTGAQVKKGIEDYLERTGNGCTNASGLEVKLYKHTAAKPLNFSRWREELDNNKEDVLWKYVGRCNHWITASSFNNTVQTEPDGDKYHMVDFMCPTFGHTWAKMYENGTLYRPDCTGHWREPSEMVTVSKKTTGTLSLNPDWNRIAKVYDPSGGWAATWDTTTVPNGFYYIRATVVDDDGNYGYEIINVKVENVNNQPNKPSTPAGPTSGKTGTSYTYSSSTTDPDGDQVYYWFDWDDGTNSGWIGPLASGATGSAKHTWTSQGSYQIKVKAKDTFNVESEWSDPLPITMPKSKLYINTPFLQFLQNFLQQYPILYQLLQRVLRL